MKLYKRFVVVVLTATLVITAVIWAFHNPNQMVEAKTQSSFNSVIIDGITFSLGDCRQQDKQFLVDVCYNLLDSRDWIIPDPPLLEANGKAVLASEINMVSREKGLNGEYVRRCDEISFPMEENIAFDTTFQVSISKVQVSESETTDCLAIQEKISLVEPEIRIECATQPHTSGFTVIVWPESLTFITANEYAHNIANDAHQGPWVLSNVSK